MHVDDVGRVVVSGADRSGREPAVTLRAGRRGAVGALRVVLPDEPLAVEGAVARLQIDGPQRLVGVGAVQELLGLLRKHQLRAVVRTRVGLQIARDAQRLPAPPGLDGVGHLSLEQAGLLLTPAQDVAQSVEHLRAHAGRRAVVRRDGEVKARDVVGEDLAVAVTDPAAPGGDALPRDHADAGALAEVLTAQDLQVEEATLQHHEEDGEEEHGRGETAGGSHCRQRSM